MKQRLRLALSLYAGFVTYLVITFVWGPGGIEDYRLLREYHAALSTNIEELDSIYTGLNRELDELRSDPDRIAREARSMGYLKPGEGVIRIPGYSSPQKNFTMGSLIQRYEPSRKKPQFLNAATLSAFLLCYILLSVFRGRHYGHEQKRSFSRKDFGGYHWKGWRRHPAL